MRLGFFAIFLLFVSILPLGKTSADVLPGTACDPGVYGDPENPQDGTLWNRAWMEGKREMEVAQTLILKPDSVLEYSCFSQRYEELIQRGAIWSGSGDMRKTLEKLVGDTIGYPNSRSGDYMTANFYHTLGGGLYEDQPSGICDAMYVIWELLKCTNFELHSLISFDLLAGNDIRTLPRACGPHEPDRNAKWDAAIGKAFPPPSFPAEPGGMDSLEKFYPPELDIFNYEECPIASTPIPTGILVAAAPPGRHDPETENKPGTFPDKICPAPNCYYKPHRIGQGTGKCVPN